MIEIYYNCKEQKRKSQDRPRVQITINPMKSNKNFKTQVILYLHFQKGCVHEKAACLAAFLHVRYTPYEHGAQKPGTQTATP